MEYQKEKNREKNRAIFKAIMAEKFPKLMSDTKPENQKAQRTSRKINTQNYIWAYHIRTLENIIFFYFEKNQRRKIPIEEKR